MTTLDQLLATRMAQVVPDVIGAAPAAAVRAALERAGYTRYTLLDRGRYDQVPSPQQPELFAALVGLAARVTGRSLVFAEARALRLSPGDYLLAHHDRIHDGGLVELMLDLSPARVPDAEVHYRQLGQVVFRVGSQPGTLSIVERGPTVTCNHTYVSKRYVDASVVRLVVRLRDG